MNKVIQKGEEFTLTVETRNSDSILYFLTDSQKGKITSRVQNIDSPTTIINISSEESSQLNTGTSNIKIFAISNSVLKPDFYESSFIVTEKASELPEINYENTKFSEKESEYWIWVAVLIAIILGIVIYLKKRN
jgi:peptide/nickel transport system substrate-binding protein